MEFNGGQFKNYEQVQAYLFGLKTGGVKFGIDRMAWLVERLGHPQKAVPVVHVAGTNGKGSVCAMVEAIFRGAGKRVGLYTSPHLVRLGERVQVDRVRLSEAEICAYVEELSAVAAAGVEENGVEGPSFFEFMTAMAFLQFERKKCDLAVIEVGLGGRLDATNVIARPEVAVITSIGLDHCEILGDTLGKIAAEKAGIIKRGCPVVMGRLPKEAEDVVRAIAAERGAKVHAVQEEFGEEAGGYPGTGMAGDFQRYNAGTATLVARLVAAGVGVGWGVGEEEIRRGLAGVVWPGRWQRIEVGGRPVILDASHNPEGAGGLDGNLARLVAETGRKPVVVTGVLGTARARPLLEVVARHAAEIHLVRPEQARACSLDELAGLVPTGFGGKVCKTSVDELFGGGKVTGLGEGNEVVVVTGSIYLAGEVLARLEPEGGSAEEESRLQDF